LTLEGRLGFGLMEKRVKGAISGINKAQKVGVSRVNIISEKTCWTGAKGVW
jgi:hypothetical protein